MSDINYNNAADTIQRLATQYQGLVDAAEALRKLGSLTGHAADLEAKIALLEDRHEEAKHDLAGAEEQIKIADAYVKDVVKEAEDKARSIKLAAESEAKQIRSDAVGDKQREYAEAREGVQKIRDLGDQAAAQARAELIPIQEAIAAATAAADAATAEADAITKKLAALRASAQKIAGG